MSHYAIISPPFYSHVKALSALGAELAGRGHRITFIQQGDARSLISDPRLAFYAVGGDTHGPGSLAHSLQLLARPGGLSLFRLINDLAGITDMLCRELPVALKTLEVDGLIVDQMEPAGGLAAEALGLPFVSVACALPVNREAELPLPVMPFDYATDAHARRKYHASARVYDWMMRRQGDVLEQHARALGLAPRRGLHEWLSPLAQLSQTIPSLDFPRPRLPESFHAVGPLRPASQHTSLETVMPPGSGRPLVYASLGTLQGHRAGLFKKIALACRDVGADLLVAHCGGLTAAQAEKLYDYGATRVTDFTDQPAAIRQAQAVITHGGLNTVLDAVAGNTPTLVIPVAFDQPGVAARVVYSGIGERVSRFASRKTLAARLEQVLSGDPYRQRLFDVHAELQRAGGAPLAADIAEQALGGAEARS